MKRIKQFTVISIPFLNGGALNVSVQGHGDRFENLLKQEVSRLISKKFNI